MARLSEKERNRRIQNALRTIGWPIKVDGVIGPRTREAIEDFKRGYAFKADFDQIDGSVGPVTYRRLRECAFERNGRCSRHFAFREFKSKGNGWIRVEKELVRGLEEYRRSAGATPILSGYRDPQHNANVGGATDSQHKYGTAADLGRPALREPTVRNMRRFSGIGVQRATGLVRHVDVRHAGPNNTTGGTPNSPTIWFYD